MNTFLKPLLEFPTGVGEGPEVTFSDIGEILPSVGSLHMCPL